MGGRHVSAATEQEIANYEELFGGAPHVTGPVPAPLSDASESGAQGGGTPEALGRALGLWAPMDDAPQAPANMDMLPPEAQADPVKWSDEERATAAAEKQRNTLDNCMDKEAKIAEVFCEDRRGPLLPNGHVATPSMSDTGDAVAACEALRRDGLPDRVTTSADANSATNGDTSGVNIFGIAHGEGVASKTDEHTDSEQATLKGFPGYAEKCVDDAMKGGGK